MAHRKVCSQGSIPFSWEAEPGVSKAAHRDSPADVGLHTLKQTSSHSPTTTTTASDSAKLSAHDIQLPLPPCPLQPPRRSTSKKGHLWKEDPFLVAYNECTKGVNTSKPPRECKKGIGSKLRKAKSIFSCKDLSEVEQGSILKLSQLPSVPIYNINGGPRRVRRDLDVLLSKQVKIS